jgi:hypothetical protein
MYHGAMRVSVSFSIKLRAREAHLLLLCKAAVPGDGLHSALLEEGGRPSM